MSNEHQISRGEGSETQHFGTGSHLAKVETLLQLKFFVCVTYRLQLFADSFRDHQVKSVSHTPATPLIMHLDYAEFTQTLIHVK